MSQYINEPKKHYHSHLSTLSIPSVIEHLKTKLPISENHLPTDVPTMLHTPPATSINYNFQYLSVEGSRGGESP